MNFEKALTRRESIKKLLRVSGCLTIAGPVAFASNIRPIKPAGSLDLFFW
jgi:hypothetical protein